GPQADDRHAAAVGVIEALHDVVGIGAKAEEHDDRVGRVERFRAGEALLIVGVDDSIRVHGHQYRAFEPVPLPENLAQHGTPFLGGILFAARKKDEILPVPRAGLALVGDPIITPPAGGEDAAETKSNGAATVHRRTSFRDASKKRMGISLLGVSATF